MSEEIQLTYHADRLLSRLKNGQVLIAEADHTEEGIRAGGLRFWLRPSGKRCGPAGARELIEKGAVEPLGDGLLADCSQSYRAAA